MLVRSKMRWRGSSQEVSGDCKAQGRWDLGKICHTLLASRWRARDDAIIPSPVIGVLCEAALGPVLQSPLPHFVPQYMASLHMVSILWASTYHC